MHPDTIQQNHTINDEIMLPKNYVQTNFHLSIKSKGKYSQIWESSKKKAFRKSFRKTLKSNQPIGSQNRQFGNEEAI